MKTVRGVEVAEGNLHRTKGQGVFPCLLCYLDLQLNSSNSKGVFGLPKSPAHLIPFPNCQVGCEFILQRDLLLQASGRRFCEDEKDGDEITCVSRTENRKGEKRMGSSLSYSCAFVWMKSLWSISVRSPAFLGMGRQMVTRVVRPGGPGRRER